MLRLYKLKQWLKILPIIGRLQQHKWLTLDLLNSRLQTLLAIQKVTLSVITSATLGLNKTQRNEPVVVSLTCFGQRINTVHHTIVSLLNQSERPDKLILWLAENEFVKSSLPSELTVLEQYGLEIAFYADVKSYKKLVPTLIKEASSVVITFDDDVIYPQDQIERLLNAHQQFPEAVVCHRAHKVLRNTSGSVLPYKEWQYDASAQFPSFDLVPIGIGGVLYPANCFDNEVFKADVFTKLCPTADDLWFKFMSLRAGRKVKVVDNPMPYEEYLQIPQLNQQSLWDINMSQNDVQLKKLLSHYPSLTFWP